MVHNNRTRDDLSHDELVKRHCDWEPEAFAAFWDAYPRNLNKVYAMRAWDRLRLPESEISEMMAFLKVYGILGRCGDGVELKELEQMRLYPEAYEYYKAWGFIVLPADVFLLDQPWWT